MSELDVATKMYCGCRLFVPAVRGSRQPLPRQGRAANADRKLHHVMVFPLGLSNRTPCAVDKQNFSICFSGHGLLLKTLTGHPP